MEQREAIMISITTMMQVYLGALGYINRHGIVDSRERLDVLIEFQCYYLALMGQL